MGPVLSLAASQSNDGETAFFLMLSCRVTQNHGTKRGSIVRTLLRLMRSLCPAFAPCALSPTTHYQTTLERVPLNSTISKIKALLGNGLNGIDLVRVWVTWRVLPLSRCFGLMCTYTGEKDDPLCHSPHDLRDDVVDATTQSLLKEGTVMSNAFDLLPFCKNNPAPAVSYQSQ